MSPILTRPVREQLEHDRIIRLLQARYRRKFEVVINPGGEQNTSVMRGEMPLFPDLVLFSQERGRRLQGTVEVETGESVNTLEALAQWGPFSRLRVPFILYVPPTSLDTARRLCAEHSVQVAEMWTFHTALDQIRFTMVHRTAEAAGKARPMRAPEKAVQTKPAASEKKSPGADRKAADRKPAPKTLPMPRSAHARGAKSAPALRRAAKARPARAARTPVRKPAAAKRR